MRFLIGFCSLLCMGALDAQETSPPLRPPFIVKISPLELLNPYQHTLAGQLDVPVGRRWTVDLGIGRVVGSQAEARYIGERFEGWKFKPGFKFFLDRTARSAEYLGLVFKYNDLYNDRYQQVLRQGGQYVEEMLVRKHWTTRGVAVRAGTQQFIGKKRRFVFEFNAGAGIRQRTIAYSNLPADAEVQERVGLFVPDRRPGTRTLPDLVLNISLGWAF